MQTLDTSLLMAVMAAVRYVIFHALLGVPQSTKPLIELLRGTIELYALRTQLWQLAAVGLANLFAATLVVPRDMS